MAESAFTANGQLDRVQFGRLIESVEQLTRRVDLMAKDLQHLSHDLEVIKRDMASGKGVFAGAILASAGLSAGVVKLLEKFL